MSLVDQNPFFFRLRRAFSPFYLRIYMVFAYNLTQYTPRSATLIRKTIFLYHRTHNKHTGSKYKTIHWLSFTLRELQSAYMTLPLSMIFKKIRRRFLYGFPVTLILHRRKTRLLLYTHVSCHRPMTLYGIRSFQVIGNNSGFNSRIVWRQSAWRFTGLRVRISLKI